MGVWRSIFGWKALFRWDALGAIVPGIFVAVGVGVMSVDWFPYHLLIAQIFFAIGALLCVIKFIGHAIESEGTRTSRWLFAIILSSIAIALTVWVDYSIQIHKELVTLTIPQPPPTPPSEGEMPQAAPSRPRPPEGVTKHDAISGGKSKKNPPMPPSVVCKDNASCGVSTGQTGGITAGTVFISPKPLPPRISAAQDGDAVTVTTTGLVEPTSLVLYFDVDVDFGGDSVGTCMSCGNGRLNDSTGKPDMKTIWIFWAEPPFLPSRPLTVFFSSKLPATLLKVTDGPDGP